MILCELSFWNPECILNWQHISVQSNRNSNAQEHVCLVAPPLDSAGQDVTAFPIEQRWKKGVQLRFKKNIQCWLRLL